MSNGGATGTAVSFESPHLNRLGGRHVKWKSVICLGVDLVQAIQQKNKLDQIPVYRASPQAIGCSLAESAEGDSSRVWLRREGSIQGCNGPSCTVTRNLHQYQP
jgi:hypothetical protein